MAGLTELASRNLKAELARRDKTPKDLAGAWGCEVRAVNARLQGRIPISTDEIEKTAALFDMEPENLVMLLIQPLDSIRQFKP